MSSLSSAQQLFSHTKPQVRRRDTVQSTTSTQSLSSSLAISSASASEEDTASEDSKADFEVGDDGKADVEIGDDSKAEVEVEEDPFPDFLWMTTEEPHRSRRIAIMKAHPEVRRLMGPTRLTAIIALSVLCLQLTIAILLRSSRPFSLPFVLTAYIIGGTANQNIFLAIHEITHNLAFKSIKANKILAITVNLAIGVPYAMAFKGYHIEHHKFLGEDGIDTDLPSRLEAMVLNNVAGKTFFATFQLLFYAIRPGFIRSQTPTKWHALNLIAVLVSDAILVHLFGWRPLVYLIMSSFFAGSLHPCAAHFIAEHYLMDGPLAVGDGDVKGLAQETTSYYGWLNVLCYNVGYHNEHHDFPSVPWTRLPALRALAREFYDPLPSHASWPYVTWKFITDPSVGMWCRAKRVGRGEKLEPMVWVAKCTDSQGQGLQPDSTETTLSADSEYSYVLKTKVDKAVVEDEVDEEEATERGYASDRDSGVAARRGGAVGKKGRGDAKVL